MRLALLLVWAVVAAAVLWSLLRHVRVRRRIPISPSDELVKDPVCQTYVVRSRALLRREGDFLRYFCSEECARRFAGGERGDGG